MFQYNSKLLLFPSSDKWYIILKIYLSQLINKLSSYQREEDTKKWRTKAFPRIQLTVKFDLLSNKNW